MNFSFRPHERLTRSRDFDRARRKGRRRVGRRLVLWAFRREESPARATRLGVVVGRRHGGAVQRNRFKRRVRDIFRTEKNRWPRGWDLVVTPKTGGPAFPPPHDDLRADFLFLVERSAHGDK
ncbi:MAG: ribonuclease P protein component [Elusimicrobia bacterium]|nr:ribonuclease P protein component [Elusimicrobiota bacterium]